ncbi:MAG: hypothetical protein HIU87_01895 [Acidobacteria bacterium]|nr:hypothetical protein [Acidobacteriota bacterium]
MKISFRFPHTASSNATREYRRRVLLQLCVLVTVLPLAWRGASCGHDFDFHLQSWLEAAQAWRHGVFYPHWMASANYGAGEPRFVFYPPLTWMLGALLGTVLPWTWTPLAFTLVALAGCVAAFYTMACEWMTHDAAAVAACLYLVNPYLLFVAYERTAYGELVSAAWMPLLVLFALRQRPAAVPLALVVAALWLTNAPSAVMGCYLLAVIVAVAAIRERSLRLVLRAAWGVVLGLGMAAVYVWPALYEQRWVEIARAVAPGMRIEDSFLFGYTGAPFHDQVLRTASWIAVALLGSALAGVLLARDKRRGLWLPMTAAAALAALLLFPWSGVIWRTMPEMKFLQFPWRWLLVMGMAAAALAGLALRGQFQEAATRGAIRTRAVTILTVTVLMTLLASHFFWQFCDDEDNVRAQRATLQAEGFQGSDEYTPSGAKNAEIAQQTPLVRVLRRADAGEASSVDPENPDWKPDVENTIAAAVQTRVKGAERMSFTIDSPQPGFAVLRLLEYPAWQVRRNGQTVSARPHREDGLMTIPIAAGRSQITVHYAATDDMWTGRGIAAASLLVLLALKKRGKLQI